MAQLLEIQPIEVDRWVAQRQLCLAQQLRGGTGMLRAALGQCALDPIEPGLPTKGVGAPVCRACDPVETRPRGEMAHLEA